jgi:hypothetical protein
VGTWNPCVPALVIFLIIFYFFIKIFINFIIIFSCVRFKNLFNVKYNQLF